MLDPRELFKGVAKDTLKPPPNLTVSQWSDGYRFLENGRWRTSNAEYQRGVMDCLAEGYQKVVLMCGSQLGKSEMLLNCLGYAIHLDPSPMLLVQPTLEMSDSFSKERIAPMIRLSPVLTKLIANPRSRDSGNTTRHKMFPGGFLAMAGANSPAGLASRPIRCLYCDEIDRWSSSAGSEGDPLLIATKRTTNYWNRVVFMCSTPGLKSVSRIYKEWLSSDQRHYLVPCPHCGFMQPLEWDNIVYPEKGGGTPDYSEPKYQCIGCKKEIDEKHKASMISSGQWKTTAASDLAGFHLNQLYSPWRTWSEIAEEYERSKDDPEMYQVFVNTALGLPYEGLVGEKADWERLWHRSQTSDYKLGRIPEKVLLLTAGVDVQGDRLEVSVWGWGRGEEGWLISHDVILGEPMHDEVWQKLDSRLSRVYLHPLGGKFKIKAVCIDTGYLTREVYIQIRKRKNKHWMGIKGYSGNRAAIGRPSWQEISYRGKVIKEGVRIFPLGVDQVKVLLFNRLKNEKPGAKYINFPQNVSETYLEGLCSEIQITKRSRGVEKVVWEKLAGVNNEPLDCAVYSYAAALLAGLSGVNWSRLRAKLTVKKTNDE